MSDVAATNPDLQTIGFASDYQTLHAILRARADALRLSRESIDQLTGWADGYAGKLLSPTMMKILGEHSLGPMLEVLGIKLAVLEDPEALARFETRRLRLPRKEWQVRKHSQWQVRKRSHNARIRKGWLWNAESGREAATARMAALTPRQRRRLASRAARARWHKVQEQAES
jgi:hypothetical protein